MKQAMISSLEFKMPTMYSVAIHRNTHTIVVYFKVVSDNGQRKTHISILLALLLANITMNEYIAMVSCTFSLI
jgi:hypothetical protein